MDKNCQCYPHNNQTQKYYNLGVDCPIVITHLYVGLFVSCFELRILLHKVPYALFL